MVASSGQAMVDMVMDQGSLGLGHGAFNGMQLGGKIDTGALFLDHPDDPAQMSLCALQAHGYGGVACVDVLICHDPPISPWGGYGKG